MISFITCSAKSTKVPILKQTLHDRLMYSIEYELIVEVGADSITKAYNRGADRANGDVFVFTHEDVEVRSSGYDLLLAASKVHTPNIGVLGVAGARYLPQNCVWWQSRDINGASTLSGACAHTDKTNIWMNTYGQYNEVEVLDGVFLMCTSKTFDTLDGFDATIPGWDFYDIDFTYKASKLGFKNLTYPLFLIHHSQGDTTQKPQWEVNRKMIEQRRSKGYYDNLVKQSS